MGGALEIPPELRHYEERYWFLATQVAEIEKYKIHTVQDYLDLAAMIERGELVPVPAVTETYILLGVGQRADEEPFTKFEEEEDRTDTDPDEYQRTAKARAKLQWALVRSRESLRSSRAEDKHA